MLFSGALVFFGFNAIALDKELQTNNFNQNISKLNNSVKGSDDEAQAEYIIPDKFTEDMKYMYSNSKNLALSEHRVPPCSAASNLGMIGYVLHHDVGYYPYFMNLMSTYHYNIDDTSNLSPTMEASDFNGHWSVTSLYRLFEKTGLWKTNFIKYDESKFNSMNDELNNKIGGNYKNLPQTKWFKKIDHAYKHKGKLPGLIFPSYKKENALSKLSYHNLSNGSYKSDDYGIAKNDPQFKSKIIKPTFCI